MKYITRTCASLAALFVASATTVEAEQVFTVSSNGEIRRLIDPACATANCRWELLDRNPRTQALAATSTSLFQLHDSGAIYVWNGEACIAGSCSSWSQIDANPQGRSIAANDRNLFQLHDNGSVWRWLGQSCQGNGCPSWVRLSDPAPVTMITASGSQLFLQRSDGSIWRWSGEPCGNSCNSWEQLDRNPAGAGIASAAGALYQRHRNGSIWRWNGAPCRGNDCSSWSMLDQNPASVEIAAAPGALYQRHNDGAIWRWTGSACEGSRCFSWEMLDRNPASRGIAASEAPYAGDLTSAPRRPAPVYQVHENGAVWRWTGEPCKGSSCPGWSLISNKDAFAGFRADRGGLFVFEGDNVGIGSPPAANTLAADAFGFNDFRFARVGSRRVEMNVLVLLTTYANSSFEADQTRDFYEARYFGARARVEDYFRENAPDLDIHINLAGMIDVADPRILACAHRWAPDPPTTTGCDEPTDGLSFTTATVEQLEGIGAEDIRALDLRQYDRDGDRRLTEDELFVINLQALPDIGPDNPYDDNGGVNAGYPRCAVLDEPDIQICGRFLPIGDETNFATVVHEIAHLFGGRDLYGSASNSFRWTLMSSTWTDGELFFHLDPWHKMRMGFSEPQVRQFSSGQSGRNSLRLTTPTNSAAYEAVIFYDPRRGTDEYFMIEYRQSVGGSWERNVPVSGLVIWYVRTDGERVPVNLETLGSGFPEGAAVAIVGSPNQTVTSGNAWTSANGTIALQWPGGGDSGLRLRVESGVSAPFLDVSWWTE